MGEAGQELQAKGPLVEGAHEPKGRKEARHLKRRAGHATAKDFGLVLSAEGLCKVPHGE